MRAIRQVQPDRPARRHAASNSLQSPDEKLHLRGVATMPIAVEMVLLNNFFWHERFTWRDRAAAGLRQRAVRLCRFQAANGMVSLAGNTVLAYWLMQHLQAPPWPSAVAAIAICAPINFLVADRWVYCQAAP